MALWFLVADRNASGIQLSMKMVLSLIDETLPSLRNGDIGIRAA